MIKNRNSTLIILMKRYFNYSASGPVQSFYYCCHFKLTRFFSACLFFTFFINIHCANAQDKRVVAIGSSTTAGIAATSRDSAWTGLLSTYYKCRINVLDSVYNLGVPGSIIYNGMPSGYIPPPSRPYPDTLHNVTKAVTILSGLSNAASGVVIVNFPTNGYIKYSIQEIMLSMQTIYDTVTSRGNRCFISTTQPRSDSIYNDPLVKKKLADIKDSVLNRFNQYSLNFWDGLFDPADTSILAKYSSGDLIHFNNAGHRVLFERVLAKNIFNLPVWYSKASGNLEDLSTWGSNTDGSGTSPLDFTADNQSFNVVNNPSPAIGGNWILDGKSTQLIIGDGITPVNLFIPENYQLRILCSAASGCTFH
jgi:lysophospholipase L1-like esterase